jgi:BirA family biotin operon repressor/biotin-[acetyl-CoA-carboxylase] ligase
MKVVKVDATSSTNSFLKDYLKSHPQRQMMCVIARHQGEGRGQRGTVWQSEAGCNLTFSVSIPSLQSFHSQSFKLSALVALALKDALAYYDMPNLKIKWPNDILSRQFKIGGILIENMMLQQQQSFSIVGVGLNVNQTSFEGLPKASSMKILTGKTFDLDQLLDKILSEFEKIPKLFNSSLYKDVILNYYDSLFKFNKVTMFQFPSGELAQGLLRGIDNYGKLIVEFEEDRLESYDVKEIQLKY